VHILNRISYCLLEVARRYVEDVVLELVHVTSKMALETEV